MKRIPGWSWALALPIALALSMAIVRSVYLRRDFQRELGDDLLGPLQIAQSGSELWRDGLLQRARVTDPRLDSAVVSVEVVTDTSNGARAAVPATPQLGDSVTIGRCGAGVCAETVARVRREGGALTIVRLRTPVGDSTFPRLNVSGRVRSSRVSLLVRMGDSLLVVASASRDSVALPARTLAWQGVPAWVRRAFAHRSTSGTARQGLVYDRVLYATALYREGGWVLVREVHADEIIERMLAPLLVELLFVSSIFLFAFAWVRSRRRVLSMERERELSHMRAEFVAGVSHELRTPLAQIRLFAQLLQRGTLRTSEEQQRAYSVIGKEASRLSILVDNVLNHARRTRRGSEQEGWSGELTTDVSRDVDYVLDAFGSLAQEKGVQVVSVVQAPLTARVDPQSLRQILLNLLENAVKYGPPEQTVTIGASASEGEVHVWLADEGPGIPQEERERIWHPFERGSGARTSKVGGSGIGLSVVRDLVERAGGRVWIEDNPGGGVRIVAAFRASTEARD